MDTGLNEPTAVARVVAALPAPVRVARMVSVRVV